MVRELLHTVQRPAYMSTLRDRDSMSICSCSVQIFLFCSTGLVLNFSFVIDLICSCCLAWPGIDGSLAWPSGGSNPHLVRQSVIVL